MHRLQSQLKGHPWCPCGGFAQIDLRISDSTAVGRLPVAGNFTHCHLLPKRSAVRRFWGKYCDLLDEVKNSKALMHTIRSIYKEKTTMSELTLQNLMKKEISMGCEKCIKWGFVHEMLVSPLDTSA